LDLKANNVLYDVANRKVRLIDLGLAQPIKGNKNPYINVPGRTLRTWHGSEYLNAQHFTTSTDIYALGWMFLDVLIPLESGFHKQPPSPHCMKVAALATSIETNVLACIRRNPTRRPTCATLLAAFDLDRVR
jgi:serine/threonine protein kinase